MVEGGGCEGEGEMEVWGGEEREREGSEGTRGGTGSGVDLVCGNGSRCAGRLTNGGLTTASSPIHRQPVHCLKRSLLAEETT